MQKQMDTLLKMGTKIDKLEADIKKEKEPLKVDLKFAKFEFVPGKYTKDLMT